MPKEVSRMPNVPVKFNKADDIIRFVNIVNHFDYHVNLTSGGSVLDAKSIISAFSLSTAENVELQVQAVDCSDLLGQNSGNNRVSFIDTLENIHCFFKGRNL